MTIGKEKRRLWKVECKWGGDSRVMQLPLNGRSKKFQTSCVMLNAASVAIDVVLSRSRNWLTFELSFRPFYSRVWVERPQKTLEGRLLIWWKEKKEKDLLNCKYKVTFQPDGYAERTCAVTCFIHVGFDRRLDNIWLLKYTFVVFYLFVYLLFLLVS